MPHRIFLLFLLPSALAMMLFIALPIGSVMVQSLFVEHEQVMTVVESCDPFGCVTQTRIDAEAMAQLKAEAPAGRFNGLGTYFNSAHLAFSEIARIWAAAPGPGAALDTILDLPFYRALVFTLAFTFVVTPLSIGLGFAIALAVNAVPRVLHGVITYLTLLPMIVPSLLGALILSWMLDARGILGSSLQALLGDPTLSLKASPTLTWIVVFLYGAWSSAPFVFIVLYAGLQTVPRDVYEAATIDGASRWDRVRFVVIPHLRPLFTFLLLVSIMDNFRVFEAILGFSAQAHASSLSTLIFNDLRGGDSPLFGSAAATSMLTILCIAVLMVPSMTRTWTSFRHKA